MTLMKKILDHLSIDMVKKNSESPEKRSMSQKKWRSQRVKQFQQNFLCRETGLLKGFLPQKETNRYHFLSLKKMQKFTAELTTRHVVPRKISFQLFWFVSAIFFRKTTKGSMCECNYPKGSIFLKQFSCAADLPFSYHENVHTIL